MTAMGVAYDKGMFLCGQGRYGEAVEQFRAACAAEPEDAAAHAMLSLCLVNTDQPQAALAAADEAVRLDPDWSGAHYARAYALPHVPIEKPMRSFRLSISGGDDELKRLRRARAALDEALRLAPDDAHLHQYASELEASRGRWTASLQAAETALALNTSDVSAANARALALAALGRAHEADEAIGESLRIDPEFAPTHKARGWSLLRAGRAAEAKVAFEEALRLDPLDRGARHGRFHARLAARAAYRWPLRFVLSRAQGVGSELTGAGGALVIAFFWKFAWRMPWPQAVAVLLGIMLVLLLVVRPVVHLTARMRR